MRYKLVTFVPLSHAKAVREALGKAGAGKIGNYSFCSFSTKGVGRFRPEAGAKPYVGTVGKQEEVEEERIEVVVEREFLEKVIAQIKKAHPYDEIAYDIYPLADL